MNLRTLDAVQADLETTVRRLNSEEYGLGAAFVALYRAARTAIHLAPRQYSPTEDGPDGVETREFFVERFNQRVIYAVTDIEVAILAVEHAHRRPSSWAGRVGQVCYSKPEPAMLLTLQAALTLASVEALPDHVRVQVLAPRLSANMKRAEVLATLRTTTAPFVNTGFRRSDTSYLRLDNGWMLSLDFFDSKLHEVHLSDENSKPIFKKEYGKR